MLENREITLILKGEMSFATETSLVSVACRCVSVEQEAEDKALPDEFSHLKRNTHNAFDEMMLFARCVAILCLPTTRRGLIHQARYLVSQFNDLEGSRRRLHVFAGRDWRAALADGIPAEPRGRTAQAGRRV